MHVILVDDHPIVRTGLRALLEEQPDCRVAGEAATGKEAISMIRKEKPDVAVVDLKLPDMNGFHVTRDVKLLSPATRIVILSIYGDDFYVEEAIRLGVDAYVVKEALELEIVDAIRSAVSGKWYLSEPTALSLAASRIERLKGQKKDQYELLTLREREILFLIAEGHYNKDIAVQLTISVRTVETHRANIMRKLRLRTPADLIHFAVRRRIVKMP